MEPANHGTAEANGYVLMMRWLPLLALITGCGGALAGEGVPAEDAGTAAPDGGKDGNDSVTINVDAGTDASSTRPPLLGCDGGNYFIEVSSDAGTDMLRGRPGNASAPPDWYCGGGVGEDCFQGEDISGASSATAISFVVNDCWCSPLTVGSAKNVPVSFGQDGGGAWVSGAAFGTSTVNVATIDSMQATGDYDAVISLPKDGGALYLHGKFCIAPGG